MELGLHRPIVSLIGLTMRVTSLRVNKLVQMDTLYTVHTAYTYLHTYIVYL